MKKAIFITGTDTGVGKTIFSLLLMRYFYAKGCAPFYLKPVQTGCLNPYDADSDALFIYRHVPELREKDPADSVVYCFRNPKAPYFAARDEGEKIDIGRIRRAVAQRRSASSPLILEGAGGLMVPVTDSLLMIDLIKELHAVPIIVARAGLGTINHTVLSVEALRRREVEPGGIVFMDAGDAPAGLDMVAENMEAVLRITGITVSGVIRRISDFSKPDEKCFKPIEGISAFRSFF